MTCKVITWMGDVLYEDTTHFKIQMKYIGLANIADRGNIFVQNVEPAITQVLLDAALKTAVRDHMIATYGYSFGILDVLDGVRLLSAVL